MGLSLWHIPNYHHLTNYHRRLHKRCGIRPSSTWENDVVCSVDNDNNDDNNDGSRDFHKGGN